MRRSGEVSDVIPTEIKTCRGIIDDCLACVDQTSDSKDVRYCELRDRLRESPDDGITLLLMASHLTGTKDYECAERFLELAEDQLGTEDGPVRVRKGILFMMTGREKKGARLITKALTGVYSGAFNGWDDPIEWGHEFHGLDRVEDLIEVIQTSWPFGRTKDVALKKAEQYLAWTPLTDADDWVRFSRTLMSVGHYNDSLEALSISRELREGRKEGNEQEEEFIPRTTTGERPSWNFQDFTDDYTDAQALLSGGHWKEGIEAIITSLSHRNVDEGFEIKRSGVPDTRPYMLTLDDIIDRQIKESIMAQREYEDALSGVDYEAMDRHYGYETGDYYDGY